MLVLRRVHFFNEFDSGSKVFRYTDSSRIQITPVFRRGINLKMIEDKCLLVPGKYRFFSLLIVFGWGGVPHPIMPINQFLFILGCLTKMNPPIGSMGAGIPSVVKWCRMHKIWLQPLGTYPYKMSMTWAFPENNSLKFEVLWSGLKWQLWNCATTMITWVSAVFPNPLIPVPSFVCLNSLYSNPLIPGQKTKFNPEGMLALSVQTQVEKLGEQPWPWLRNDIYLIMHSYDILSLSLWYTQCVCMYIVYIV